MSLDRNLNINVIDYDNIDYRQLSLFRDTVMALDVTISNFDKYVDLNHKTGLKANVIFVTSNLERYYDNSKNLPIIINEDKTLKFTVDVLERYTRNTGILKMQINITDYDLCNIFLPEVDIKITQTLLEDEESTHVFIEGTNVINDVNANGSYDINDSLGAIQAADILRQISELRNVIDTNNKTLNKSIDRLSNDVKAYKNEIDGIELNLEDQTTALRINEIKKILENANNMTEINDLSLSIKTILSKIEDLQVFINNRITQQEFTNYRETQNAANSKLTQQINTTSEELKAIIDSLESKISNNLGSININCEKMQTDITELQSFKELTQKLNDNVDQLNKTISNLFNASDENLPTLKTYKVLKLKVYKNNNLAIMSDTGSGNTIRNADGLDVVINFANEVDSLFIVTVSPYSRLQFTLKSLNGKIAVIKCYNLEKVTEKVINEITGEEEEVVVMDVGVVNIHELPVDLEVHILYLA